LNFVSFFNYKFLIKKSNFIIPKIDEEWQWLQRLITVLNTAKALLTRKNFPETFTSYFLSGLNGTYKIVLYIFL